MPDWSALREHNAPVFKRLGLFVDGDLPTQPGITPTLALQVDESMLNASGLCHGGIVYALADTACAWALMAAGVQPATVDASITYLRAASVGEKVVAHPRLLKRGRAVGSCDVQLLGKGNRLIACYRGTCLHVER
ncbi:MAG: PaaI family thioesterase [Pseudomonadales bacterium]